MRKIIKARFVMLVIWILASVLLTVFQPDINKILRDRGQSTLSSDSSSVIADNILKKFNAGKPKGSSDIIVFYDKNKISDDEMDQIKAGVDSLKSNKSKLGINGLVDPFNIPEAKSSLISKDGTTLMVSITLDKKSRTVSEIKKEFNNKLSKVHIKHYLTGADFINDDYLRTSQSGVEKSAVLTVIFILVVLTIVFRSVVAPLISLVAVLFSYLCSMGIAAQLIDKAGFPLTSLTQMLLVLILFGIGTDYNILLFNRFKEELSHGYPIDDAIVKTYKTSGKTIGFSILTVFVAFLSLSFAKSPIYQSGVIVVIGAVMLLLEILTLTPFIMKTLGNKLFWPSKNASGHKENKLWGKTASVATNHPIISVVLILLIIVSSICFNHTKLNFDMIGELGNKYESTMGFNILSEHFGKGQAMPTTVVIEDNKALNSNQYLQIIDNVTEKIKNVKGVSKVDSATQPEGKPIDDLYVGSQTKTVTNGLSKTQDGIDQIYNGLELAQKGLTSADFSKAGEMATGTAKLQNGMSALANGLKQIQNGIGGGSGNTQSITNGISTIRINLSKMSVGVKTLADKFNQMQAGYAQMGKGYQGSEQALLGVKSSLSQMQALLTALGNDYPPCKNDSNYQKLNQTINGLSSSLSGITPEEIQTLDNNYNSVTSGFATANKSLESMSGGLSQMADGLQKLESGLDQTSSGIGTIVTNMNTVTNGLGQMVSGQQQLATGLNGISAFGNKLSDVNDGLKKISNGLGKTNDFLKELNTNKSYSIPAEALNSSAFKKALDNYLSSNKRITKMTVILKDDPYSLKAGDTTKQIKDAVASGIKGTALSNAKYGVSGPSATTADTNDILTSDLSRTSKIVIVAVFLILVIIIRSVWEPLCITAALAGAYYTAMAVINFIFINIIGYVGISSYVPFFSFIIIVSLGVDYSIFLMMRFKEYENIPPKQAIILAAKKIGGVVMSAVVILGGTFATLMPSGMVLLLELASAVIVGLIMICFVFLPIFLPAAIALPSVVKGMLSKRKKDLSMEEKDA